MKTNKNQILICLICTLFISKACLAFDFFDFGEDENVFWKSGINQYVKLAEQDDSSFGKNEHPVTLETQSLKMALEALIILDDGFFIAEETYKHIFSVQQTRILADSLSKALSKAAPNQDIIFALAKTDKKFLKMSETRFLAGRAFFKDNKLNIIIGDYDFFSSKAFEKEYDPGRNQVPYDLNNGRRTKATKTFDGIHIDVTGVDNKKLKNKLRHDWLVIDVEAAAKAYVAQKNKKDNPATEADKKLEAEAAKLAKQRREMRAEMARMRKEVQDATSNKSSDAKSIEERMATLDQLLDKKLITQDEYDNKRKEILSDI